MLHGRTLKLHHAVPERLKAIGDIWCTFDYDGSHVDQLWGKFISHKQKSLHKLTAKVNEKDSKPVWIDCNANEGETGQKARDDRGEHGGEFPAGA